VTNRPSTVPFRFALLAGMALLIASCAPYRVRGRVVSGTDSFIAVVEPHDPRLSGRGLADVELDLTINPARLSQRPLRTRLTTPTGEFSIPIRKAGIRIMHDELSLFAHAPGFDPIEGIFTRPPKGKRVLVVLAPESAVP